MLLYEAFPLLQELVRDGFLVALGSPEGEPIGPRLRLGTRVQDHEVVNCLQVMDDTELYQVRDSGGTFAALKIVRHPEREGADAMIEHEARILGHLDGVIGPRLLDRGEHDGRRYLIAEWISGVSPTVAAEEFRSTSLGHDRRALLRLAHSIVATYAGLHASHVVHGDMHPRNCLIELSGRARLVDFGLARLMTDPEAPDRSLPRGGVMEFLEPEFARAVNAGVAPPPATVFSDQYGVGALLFRLCTGSSYLRFSLVEEESYRQIASAAPLTFTQCGVMPWPEVEELLTIALSKEPGDRHDSMARFAERVGRASSGRPVVPAGGSTRLFDEVRARVRARLGPGGPLLKQGLGTPPLVSLQFGAAGLAWAASRFAAIEGDGEWLAAAELWLHRARLLMDHPNAFAVPQAGLPEELVGHISPYHSPAGVHLTEAMVAAALDDRYRLRRSIRSFIEQSRLPCDQMDLAFGLAGSLLGCALLYELPWLEAGERAALTTLGEARQSDLLEWLYAYRCRLADPSLLNLGMAHGWAGLLYAVLRWSEAAGGILPDVVPERLVELADRAEPSGRGIRWHWSDTEGTDDAGATMPGWCNGAAGFVHLWAAAHRHTGEERFARSAHLAAWEAWEHPGRARNLCCGLAGRAYALLAWHRHTGDKEWLRRAWRLGEAAVSRDPTPDEADFPDSLYKGDIGVALLAADLAQPEGSSMPCFEPAGWARGGGAA
jgi:serine/threonine-protein kinase